MSEKTKRSCVCPRFVIAALLVTFAGVTGAAAAENQSILDVILSQMQRRASVADLEGTVLPGATSRFPLAVDGSVKMLTVLLTWPVSGGLELTLLSPSGKSLAASTDGRAEETWQMLRVDEPESGNWTVVVKGASSAGTFRLRASADSPIRLRVESLETAGPPATKATLDGFPTTTQVRARVERPDGKTEDARVEQDGGGLVARYARADIPGSYTFLWSARAGAISRAAAQSIAVNKPVVVAEPVVQSLPPATPAVHAVPTARATTPAAKPPVPAPQSSIQGGTVQSVDGQYIRWNRGSLQGIRHGLPVRIVRQGREIGRGRAIDVRSSDSDVEIDFVSGVSDIAVGDAVEVETSGGSTGSP